MAFTNIFGELFFDIWVNKDIFNKTRPLVAPAVKNRIFFFFARNCEFLHWKQCPDMEYYKDSKTERALLFSKIIATNNNSTLDMPEFKVIDYNWDLLIATFAAEHEERTCNLICSIQILSSFAATNHPKWHKLYMSGFENSTYENLA